MRKYRNLILVGLLIAGVVAASSAWLASDHPDGLSRVAQDQQFSDRAQDPGYRALPNYTIPGVDGPVSKALAGIVGVAAIATLTLGMGYLLRRRRPPGPGNTREP